MKIPTILAIVMFSTHITLSSGIFDLSSPEHNENEVVSEAVRIRARNFEEIMGFEFDWQWMETTFVELRPDLRNSDAYNEKSIKAEYSAEKKKIIFSFRLVEIITS